MKKKLTISLILGVLCCLLFALVGCGKKALDTPRGLLFNPDTLELTWDEVNHASSYLVDVGNGEEPLATRRPTYSLARLSAGTYNVRVCAVDDGKDYANSKWSAKFTFERADESGGVQYQLSTDESYYEVVGVGSAAGEVTIKSTYRGKPVLAIAKRAFSGAALVTEITVEEGITSIGERAFMNCAALERVTLPNTVKNVGQYAFQSCKALQYVNLPVGITEIADYTFSYCEKLAEITIPQGVTSIGKSAFNRCSTLQTVIIPDNVVSIGERAFAECSSVSSFSLGSKVQTIATNAFTRCNGISEIILPDFVSAEELGVQTIGAGAFSHCENLLAIDIPDSVKEIGDEAFLGCIQLEDIDIGKGVRRIGIDAFTNTVPWDEAQGTIVIDKWILGTKYYELVDVGGVETLVDNRGKAYELAVDEFGGLIIDDGIVGIADWSFYEGNLQNTYITEIILPDSVKVIGVGAFAANASLRVVQLGAGLELIDRQAFDSCELLQELSTQYNESLVEIGAGAFQQCKALYFSDDSKAATLVIPETVKEIHTYAFYGCNALKNVDLPDGLERIGARAFRYSELPVKNGFVIADNWLVDIDLDVNTMLVPDEIVGIADYTCYENMSILQVDFQNSQLKRIGKGTFIVTYVSMGTSLDGFITIPGSVEKLDEYAFYGASLLSKVKVGEGTKEIGRSAFYASGLTAVTLPSTLEKIDDYAFFGCTALKEIVIPASVKEIGDYAFFGCTALTKITIATSDTPAPLKIGRSAFMGCTALATVNFGSGIVEIGERAFVGCESLGMALLPNSLQTIERHAFFGCTSLSVLSLGSALENIGDYAFMGCTALKKVLFPASIQSIGTQAFMGCTALKTVILPSSVQTLEAHAFYNCPMLVIYCEGAAPASWENAKWNSSYLPIVSNVTVYEGEGYLLKWTVSPVANAYNAATFAPERDGYVFGGWTSVLGSSEAEYTTQEAINLPEGTQLYPIWTRESSTPSA